VTRTQEALRKITGQVWNLRVELVSEATALPASVAEAENSQSRSRRQRTEAMQLPLVKRAFEVLGAQFVHLDEGFGAAPSEPAESPSRPDAPETEEP
jgi:hypothetical protein